MIDKIVEVVDGRLIPREYIERILDIAEKEGMLPPILNGCEPSSRDRFIYKWEPEDA